MAQHILRLFIDSNDEVLLDKYREAVQKHNDSVANNYPSGNSGFDLYCPVDVRDNINDSIKEDEKELSKSVTLMADMQVSGAMFVRTQDGERPTGYCLYPRSSLSKLPLRLANSVGIIDNTYRGHLIAALDVICSSKRKSEIDEYHRLVQICEPGLNLFHVELVGSLEELGRTDRGSGGFGSTGTN